MTVSAPLTCQTSVDVPPWGMVSGAALKRTICGALPGVTETVTLQVAIRLALVAVSV